MYNWKLRALFVIGLMMIVGVFNNAAMTATNDGEGEVEVEGGSRDAADDGISTVGFVPFDTNTLAAGSIRNALKFTYTARDEDNEAINMAGGRVRIAFPSGWKVSNKFIKVTDGDLLGPGNNGVVYETGGDGNLVAAFNDDDERERVKANAKVTFEANRRITVTLGSNWGSGRTDEDRKLEIILADIIAPIPRHLTEDNDTPDDFADDFENIQFQCSSSAANGTLSRLSDSVYVQVGNILGDRDLSDPTDPETRDPLIREFKVTPTRVFPGETNIRFKITFTAPGPMYGSALQITVPSALQTKPDFDNTVIGANKPIKIVGGGGATIDDDDDDKPSISSGNILTIRMDKIDKGERVTVSYDIATVGGTIGQVTATTTVNATEEGAKVTGGVASAVAGSGSMSISPTFVEVGSPRRTITLIYTAYTDFTDASPLTLEIEPMGIDISGGDEILQKDNSDDYGYVSGPSSSDLTIIDGDTIKWTGITLRKNRTLRTTIRRVDILPTADNYSWTVKVNGIILIDDPTTRDLDERPVLSVVSTSGNPVLFEIDGDTSFHAASQGTIIFKFTTESTPIRNGRVSLTIPSDLGSAPTTAEGRPGRVTATIERSGEPVEAKQPTVSGRTVNVAVKQLAIGGIVKVKYGDTTTDDGTTDDRQKAEFHHVANDAVRVTGTFRVSSSASTRSVGRRPMVTLKNVADGTGSATLSPTAVEAGSDNRTIEIVFTAAGTMDGGKINLEIPSGWGSMQEDPTLRNYVTTRGSAVSSLQVGSTTATATVRKLGRGGSIRFIYGGGTSSTKNGVEVQPDTGIASFMVKSDGDGDDVFKRVKSDVKHEGREQIRNPKKLGRIYADAPGVLQIQVGGAVDGTGTATVEPREVRAAEAVRLVFTYNPGQTIEDGALRFTVPTGWSKPEVDDAGSPGYTEFEGLGLGTATDNGRSSVTVPIYTLDRSNTITITYGATDTGRAIASAATGTDTFRIEVKGHEGGSLKAIRRQPTVTVRGQASGEGKAVLTVRPVSGDTALYAGDTRRQITIIYTAAGQIVSGRARFTIPFNWSRPTTSTVTVRPSIPTRYDGQIVVVEGINLDANGRLTFVYTGNVQPRTASAVKFGVEVHSGFSGDSFEEVTGEGTMLTVEVREARPGSGSGRVTPTSVALGATGVNLTFTYTAVGEISGPREFRVQVPSGWPPPSAAATSPNNRGTYTVVHRHRSVETTTSVEKLNPAGRDMIARVRLGGLEVEAEDQIIFTYQNVAAPATSENSIFRMFFDGAQIRDNTQVRVGTGTPTPPVKPVAPVTPVTPVVLIITATIDKTIAKAGDRVTVTAIGTSDERATFSIGSVVPNVAMTESPAGTYTGRFTVVDRLHDGTHTVTVNLNSVRATAGALTIDTAAPTVTVTASPDTVSNGDTVTITATVSEAVSSVAADVSALDTTQTAPIQLTLSTYRTTFTLGDDNEAASGPQTIIVTATDAAGNSGMGSTTVMLTNILRYTSTIPSGVSLFHVPLEVDGLDNIGDLRRMLGNAVSLLITYNTASGTWNSRSDAVPITADLGIVASMNADQTVTFTGNAWGDGTSMISLKAGTNLIGLPVNDPDVVRISDIMGLFGRNVVANIIIAARAGQFGVIGRAGDPGDGPVMGDAAYLVTATTDASATVRGDGWRNGGTTAAPIALAGYKVDGQTPVLDIHGAVVDEITGLARGSFRVKVKNLSTKVSLSRVTSVETAAVRAETPANGPVPVPRAGPMQSGTGRGGYNMTFVDLTAGHAARVGDVLEISADSPDPLIGVQPVRHIVTVDDVKSGILEVEDLIAYEIPAETELLRNYPNPFNPETWIPYRLAEDAVVTLTIYDTGGAVVRSIDVGHKPAAVYESRAKAIYWDGRNRFGEQVASGMYFYSLSAGDFSATRKMLILK